MYEKIWRHMLSMELRSDMDKRFRRSWMATVFCQVWCNHHRYSCTWPSQLLSKKKRLLNSLWMTFCTLDLSIYTYTTLYKHSLNWPNPQIRNTDLILQLVAWRSKPKNPQPVSSMMDVSGHSVSNLSWYHPCGIRGLESKMIQQIMIWINHNKSIISFNML